MSTEYNKPVIIVYADSKPAEKRKQLNMLQNLLFTKQPDSTKLRVQVLHMATALMLMKRKALPPKEVFIRFLKLSVKCAVPTDLIDEFIEAFEVAGSKPQSFADMETPPSKIKSGSKGSKTSPTREAKVSDELSSDSSDSERKSWPDVTIVDKHQRANRLLNLVHEFDPSKKSSSDDESTIEEILKNLKPSLVKLSYQEWGAILETFLRPDEMRAEQDKGSIILRAVDAKMNLAFKAAIQSGGQTGLLASHLMIDLFEHCYGREAEAIVAQRQNVAAMVQSLRMDTVISVFTNQMLVEYEPMRLCNILSTSTADHD